MYILACTITILCDVYNTVVALLAGELTIAPSNSPPTSNTPPMGGGGGDGSPGGGRDSDQSPPPMNNQLSESQLSGGGGGRSVVSGGSPFAVSANRDYHFSHIQHGQVPYTFNLPAHDYNPSNY